MLEGSGSVGARGGRVLLIDDDQDFADSLAALLELEGYLVETAHDSGAAHAALVDFRAEVALIDVRLGEASGMELIAAFRRHHPDVICVMMTAYASVDTAIEALQQGAYDYLCKPFVSEQLLAALERCFDRLNLARERDAVEAKLRRRNQELEQMNVRLHRVTQSMQAIASCLSLRDLNRTLLEEVVASVGARGGAVYLRTGSQLVREFSIGTGMFSPGEGAESAAAHGADGTTLNLPLACDGAAHIGVVVLQANPGATFSLRDRELGVILTSFGCEAIRVLRAVESLRTSEERLRRIAENSPSAISLRDLDGRFVIINRQFEAWHGFDAARATGRTVGELFAPDLAQCYAAQDREVLEAGRAINQEVEIALQDGAAHSVLMTTFPVHDGAGAVIGVGTIGTDLSAHKRAQDELRQAQKMEALGQLTGGVAHDFNNLLAVILGNLELVQEMVDEGSELSELVEDALDSASSGAELTHRLLAFGRRQNLHPQTIDPRQLIEDMSRLLERTLGRMIEVIKVLPERLWNVEVDRSQAETGLLNLAINARDAMPDGGTLTIEAANVENPVLQAMPHDQLRPGYYVRISVADTGAGMPPDVVERALQPFFTTKDVGQGSGLGLSMVYGFLKQSGGGIEIVSDPGRGSTMRLYLRRAAFEPGHIPAIPPDDHRGRGETILVVEDQPEVRRLTTRILSRLGYQVLEAENGSSALELLEARSDIDLMLADVVLPGRVSGTALAQQANGRYPKLKILHISGYAHGTRGEAGADGETPDGSDRPIRLISKPVRKNELAAIVRSTLDG